MPKKVHQFNNRTVSSLSYSRNKNLVGGVQLPIGDSAESLLFFY